MIENIVLGIVQGLTEFFPVSSSGHLVIFQNFFGMSELTDPGIYTEIFLHTGTLLAVFVLFFNSIIDILKGFLSTFGIFKESVKYRKAAWLLLLANIPAGIVGIFFRGYIEKLFVSDYDYIVYIMLIVTGLILFSGKYFKAERYGIKEVTWPKALLIGISQAAAIIPGISRSGTTITVGAALGLKRADAVRFSFLMMIPAVAGATLIELKDISFAAINSAELAAGVITSFIVGYVALKILISMVKNFQLHYFAYYCWTVGLAGIAWKIFS